MDQSDWRQGRIVYQIFVDRFHRSEASSAPPAGRRYRKWQELPKAGKFLPDVRVWSHEADFWGGDLRGIADKLDYLEKLGVEILYLTPIFEAATNHRYDTSDYFRIDPLVGTESDLSDLCERAHRRGIKVILDGVFNHTGRGCKWFKRATETPSCPEREFYEFSGSFKNGYRAWKGVPSLPELAIERPEVQAVVFEGENSVVRHYLKWIDGWRLDVAHDLGPEILGRLTAAAHRERQDSLVIGEAWNYPHKWTESMDAVVHFFLRELIFSTIREELSPRQFAQALERAIADCGIAAIRRSWLVLDNHDTVRLRQAVPDTRARQLARVLQFTLPGCPQLYYGDELDLPGGSDPENRAPMPWDRVERENDPFLRKLVDLHRGTPALRMGECRFLIAEKSIAFCRESGNQGSDFEGIRWVIANPSGRAIEETVVIPDYRVSHHAWAEDVLTGRRYQFETASLMLKLEPYEMLVLKPVMNHGEYRPYRRL